MSKSFPDCPLKVETSSARLAQAIDNCTGLSCLPSGLVHPSSEEEVCQLARYATKMGIPLYPFSVGNNWGYGSRSPMRDGALLVDLSGMNRILDYDPTLGLVRIEPGVTQKSLFEFLKARGDRHLVPTTGGGPNCSILGNTLERGFGLTPHCDHFSAMMGLKAVLADGEIYRSLFTELTGDQALAPFKWGMGPYLDGLFSQGNFGIVTEMTLALAPRPQDFRLFFFSVSDPGQLEEAAATVRSLLEDHGGCLGGINLMNDLRMLSMIDHCPPEAVKEGREISSRELAELRSRNGIGYWTGMGCAFGQKAVLDASFKDIKRRLKGRFTRVVVLSESNVAFYQAIARALPFVQRTQLYQYLLKARLGLRILSGEPSETALPLVFWKTGPNPGAGEIDPDRTRAGLYWFSPIIPAKEPIVRDAVTVIERVCRKHRIDPLITLTAFNHRAFDCTVPILFDRGAEGQTARALACYKELVSECRKLGIAPYRTGIQGTELGIGMDSQAFRFIDALKAAIDPSRILAPGRYSAPAVR